MPVGENQGGSPLAGIWASLDPANRFHQS